MRPELRRMLTHRVTIVKLNRNYSGELVETAEHLNVPAFVQYGQSIAYERRGETVPAEAMAFLSVVFLAPEAPINMEHEHWRIKQTHPYARRVLIVQDIQSVDDPRTGRRHHYEVLAR